ncbi:unnamed protein product [Prunus brigantina]
MQCWNLVISLAKDLLKVHRKSLALVLSMEAVTPNGYGGREKSMLLPNILFWMGGAAILLSNRKQDKRIAKYELQHLVRTHIDSDNQAYQYVFQQPDEAGHVGVSLSWALLHVAVKARRNNMSALGPLVLPYAEQLRYGWPLCYLEAKGRVMKGNPVWQIAFGSGFKCNSAVWKCISDIDPTERNAWSDRVDSYPVNEIPNATF